MFLGGAPVTPEFLTTLGGWLHPDDQDHGDLRSHRGRAGRLCLGRGEDRLDRRRRFRRPADGGHRGRGRSDRRDHHQGPSLFVGYIGQPPRIPGDGFPTGDLGRIIDRDGAKVLTLLGRAKDMIIRAGVNIYPSTLEAELRAITDADRATRCCAKLRSSACGARRSRTRWWSSPGRRWPARQSRKRSLSRLVERVTGAAAKPDYMMRVDPDAGHGPAEQGRQGCAPQQLRPQRFGLDRNPEGPVGAMSRWRVERPSALAGAVQLARVRPQEPLPDPNHRKGRPPAGADGRDPQPL